MSKHCNIFDRYYRGTDTQNTTGTGLGTVIAKQLIEAHGGTLDVKSSEGKGTSFYITMPPIN